MKVDDNNDVNDDSTQCEILKEKKLRFGFYAMEDENFNNLN